MNVLVILFIWECGGFLSITLFFPAGDFVKFGFPMAYTITVLSWGVVDHEIGYINASSYNTVILKPYHLL